MKQTKKRVDKLVNEIIESMDLRSLYEIAKDRLIEFYSNKANKEDFEDEWDFYFGDD